MKKRLLIISGLSLAAVSAAIGHTMPSEVGKFVAWLSHIESSKKLINNPHLIVEHNGEYCPAVYRTDRSHAGEDIKLGTAPCLDKSEYEKRTGGTKSKKHTHGDVTILHPPACPSACGSQVIGPYVYNWCWQDPVPSSEPKMSVDIYYGSPSGAHIDKFSADSSGRPGTC